MAELKKLKGVKLNLAHKFSKQEVERLLCDIANKNAQIEAQNQSLQETLEELEESRSRYADLYDYAPVGYVTLDYNGCILEMNLTGAILFGKLAEFLIGMPLVYLIANSDHKDFINHIQQCRKSEKKVTNEFLLNKNEGEPKVYVQLISDPVQHNSKVTSYRTIITDITERRIMEKELSRLERFNLIGEMMASIAHEIRNPMTTVRGFLQLFREKTENVGFIEEFDLMIQELDRANSIITEFLSLAKSKEVNMEYKNLNNIIEEIYPLLNADVLLGDCEITLDLGSIPDILVDANEIRQIIFNLVRNGVQAMLMGGKIVIKTFMKDNEVILAVQDEGAGISKEVYEKLGTPFLTTKNDGTGLGLSVCYSIANRHNAKIKAETSSAGTTFYVVFGLESE
jgi:PAS domain S-box-containing protein